MKRNRSQSRNLKYEKREESHNRRKNRPAIAATKSRRVRLDGDVLSPKRTIEKRNVERLRRQIIPTVKCYGGLYNSNTNVIGVTMKCNLSQ